MCRGLMELCSLALILLAPCPSSLYLTVPLIPALPPAPYPFRPLSLSFSFIFTPLPIVARFNLLIYHLGFFTVFFFFYIDVLDDILTLV